MTNLRSWTQLSLDLVSEDDHNTAALVCGSGPGISPGVHHYDWCSHGGTICWANMDINNQALDSTCVSCGGGAINEPTCTPTTPSWP